LSKRFKELLFRNNKAPSFKHFKISSENQKDKSFITLEIALNNVFLMSINGNLLMVLSDEYQMNINIPLNDYNSIEIIIYGLFSAKHKVIPAQKRHLTIKTPVINQAKLVRDFALNTLQPSVLNKSVSVYNKNININNISVNPIQFKKPLMVSQPRLINDTIELQSQLNN
tara:strand:- start:25 stop:534 length:510 start_codon:yes stop_codon:yes gene_type:complete